MANRYDQWESTGPIELPIETYQGAGLIQDQRTQASVDQVASIFNAYGSINPASADAKAVYDAAMEKLRTQVTDAAKLKLDTPEAKIRINKIISDPNITTDLKNVMMDSMYANQAQKDVNEYLKKNPSVNAVEYLSAFSRMKNETGDPTKFNPNRFKNMGPLVEYFDTNKRIEDGVSKLKDDEVSIKRIMGDKYIEYKNSGVLPEKIRQYVVSQMANDPQVQAQLQRNLTHQYFLQNPNDINAGKTALANAYRGNLMSNGNATIASLSKELAGKTSKQIQEDPKLKAKSRLLDRAKQQLDSYSNMNDDQLNETIFAENFKNGFDAMAWQHTHNGEEFNPMAMARFNWKNRFELQRRKGAMIKQMVQGPQNAPLTAYNPLEQGSVPDDKIKTTIGTIPGLEGVSAIITDHGNLTTDKVDLTGFQGIFAKTGKFKGSVVYAEKGNVISIPEGSNQKPPAGYELIGVENLPYEGITPDSIKDANKIYAKTGTVLYKDPGKNSKSLYNNAVTKVKTYLQNNDISPERYNNLSTELDMRNALKDISNFNNNAKSAYMPTYILPASYQSRTRQLVASAIPISGLMNADGKLITDSDTVKEIQNKLLDKDGKVTMGFQPVSFTSDNSEYSFSIDGKMYKVPMHTELNDDLSGIRTVVKKFMKNDNKPMSVGETLLVGDMVDGGHAKGFAIPGGATDRYQMEAQKVFEENVNKLRQVGVSRSKAVQLLNDNYEKAIEHISRTGQQFPIKVNGNQTIFINKPIRSRIGKYYTESRLFDDQEPVTGVEGFISKYMQEFGSLNNPNMVDVLGNEVDNKTMLKILTENDQDYFTD